MALDLSYRPIEADTITIGFRCGEPTLDQFLARKAWKHHQRGTILTTCAYLPGMIAPVGFYSIASVAEEVRNLPGSYHLLGRGEYFPALQLVYLAVRRDHQRREIGTSMAGAVTELFAEIGPKIGLPHLILVPINEGVVAFYEDQLGFTCYMNRGRMYLPLQSALDAMSVPPASETGDLFEGG